jgi:hypothetical protein
MTHWLTVVQAAQRKGVTERTVRNWIRDGVLRATLRTPEDIEPVLHVDRDLLDRVPKLAVGVKRGAKRVR